MGDKVRGVMRVVFKVIENSPIGAKLEASQTIVKFITNIKDGNKMKVEEILDVACAINEFLPST